MSAYAMAVGFGKNEMDQVSQAVYKQVYPKLFKGSEKVSFEGAPLTLTWDVKSAPTFVLSPPADADQMLRDHLAEAEELPKALSLDLVTAVAYEELKDSVLQMTMDDVDLGIDTGSGPPAVDKLQVVVVIEVTCNSNGTLTLNPVKATATTSNPADQTLVNKFFVPKALDMARHLLSGISLPSLSIPGVTLTPPTVCVQQDHVIVLANISGQPSPDVPQGVTWPTDGFFALFSDELRQTIIWNETKGFHQGFSKSGSVGTNLGGASYSASASISVASAGLGGNPDQFALSVKPSGNVHAQVKFLCVPVGVNYSLSTNPSNVTATIQASISSGRTVVATSTDVSGFAIILTPSGSVAEKVLSAITWPITQAVVAAFSPAIKSALEGISFPVWTVPDITFVVEDVKLTISPDNLTLGSYANMMSVTGTITIH